ncbi:MAG: hypothetical protein V1735_00090 [Nanoarchaeota archaeon]
MAKVLKETPLSEITLRRYEKPFTLAGRDLIKKVCLSLGLLQPGDSRDVVVDVLFVMLMAQKQRKALTAEQVTEKVIALRKRENLPLVGIAGSNVRRHLKRMRELFLLEKISSQYRITEFLPLQAVFTEKIERYLIPAITERLKDYLAEADALPPGSS